MTQTQNSVAGASRSEFREASERDAPATLPLVLIENWALVVMNLPSEFVLVPRPSSSRSVFWRKDGYEEEDEGRGRAREHLAEGRFMCGIVSKRNHPASEKSVWPAHVIGPGKSYEKREPFGALPLLTDRLGYPIKKTL